MSLPRLTEVFLVKEANGQPVKFKTLSPDRQKGLVAAIQADVKARQFKPDIYDLTNEDGKLHARLAPQQSDPRVNAAQNDGVLPSHLVLNPVNNEWEDVGI